MLTSLEQLIDKWVSWLRAAGRPTTTIGLRTYYVRRIHTELDISADRLTADQIVDYLARQTWSLETRRSARSSLSSFYRWMQANGLRSDNPAALLPSIKMPRGVPRPTPEHIYRQALLDADPRVALMIQLAAHTGLRIGEISRMHRRDVVPDLIGHTLRVIGKGGHERMVPLHPDLARELLEMPDAWIFPSRLGGHLTSNHAGKLVSRSMPKGWTAHTLRHRCATVAYWSTNNLRAVQELLGHARSETTDRYTLVKPDQIRAAMMAAVA